MAKTKSQLIELVAARTNITRSRAEMAVDQVFGCIKDALKRGDSIDLRGFGTFTSRERVLTASLVTATRK